MLGRARARAVARDAFAVAIARVSSATRASSARARDAGEDEHHEHMMAMEDSYGSGVMAEDKVESPEEKKRRIAEEMAARGVLVGDRVRVDVRVGAPLPERWRRATTEREGASASRGGGEDERERRTANGGVGVSAASAPSSVADATAKRWLTRAVFGYAVCVRNGRVGVKRSGTADTDSSFPTYPTSWVTVLDIGELWEICTGPRNPTSLSGASDYDLYEYQKATGGIPSDERMAGRA